MFYFQNLVIAVYFGMFILLSVYGLHRYFILYLFYKHQEDDPTPLGKLDSLPVVTVQLPIYNEKYVVERLISSAAAIDYPRELLEIQVIDDSTDETVALVAGLVERFQKEGLDIKHIIRKNREGYKAGALDNAMHQARGEFLLIYDADFIADKNILKNTIEFFSDPKVGMVQVRWGHINRNYSLLTQVQAIMLDGHFVLEHTVRNRSERFFNFNGTAGIWRQSTIKDSGGWQHDTLTEDLDLSYRAQAKGWRFVYLPDLVADAELPVDMNAFKSQQHRWAKGSIQTARKLLPSLLVSDLPFKVKLESFFHLTANFSYLVLLFLVLLLVPATVFRANLAFEHYIFYDIVIFILTTQSLILFYIASQRFVFPQKWSRVWRFLPGLMLVGIGLSVNNARAVLEAFGRRKTEFVRTPKFRIESAVDSWRNKRYRTKLNPAIFIEIGLGLYLLFGVYLASEAAVYNTIPIMLLFATGYLYTGTISLFHALRA